MKNKVALKYAKEERKEIYCTFIMVHASAPSRTFRKRAVRHPTAIFGCVNTPPFGYNNRTKRVARL